MRALVIRSPWVEMILAGTKCWELRKAATNIRGRIALIRGGSGLVVGTAELVDCIGPMSRAQLSREYEKHRAPDARLQESGYEYAWVLQSVHALRPPVPYPHPSGAVIWVDLSRAGVTDEQLGVSR